MNAPKQPATTTKQSADSSKPAQPDAKGVGEQGGMLGEAASGEPAADVTEEHPRTTRPGGMIGEG